jgi:hypothetical protein
VEAALALVWILYVLTLEMYALDDYLDAAAEDVDVRKRLRPLLDVIQRLTPSRK